MATKAATAKRRGPGRPRVREATAGVLIRVTPAQRDALNRAARERGIPANALAVQALAPIIGKA